MPNAHYEVKSFIDIMDYNKGVVAIIPDPENTKNVNSLGTGFFIDENLILTNDHVIASIPDDVELQIFMKDTWRRWPVKVIAKDSLADLAVLQMVDETWKEFKAENEYKILKLSNDDFGVIQGTEVFAIGHPHGFFWSISKGIVTAINRPRLDTINNPFRPMIQTDTYVYEGNSGGPLIDAQSGEVIGINEMLATMKEGGSYGFAIPGKWAKRMVDDMLDSDKIIHWSYLGMAMDTDNKTAKIVIDSVVDGQPAQLGGLVKGDILLSAEGNGIYRKINKTEDLVFFMSYMPLDTIVTIEVQRGDKIMKFPLKTIGKLSEDFHIVDTESLPEVK